MEQAVDQRPIADFEDSDLNCLKALRNMCAAQELIGV
jgi:hypothetical protein